MSKPYTSRHKWQDRPRVRAAGLAAFLDLSDRYQAAVCIDIPVALAIGASKGL